MRHHRVAERHQLRLALGDVDADPFEFVFPGAVQPRGNPISAVTHPGFNWAFVVSRPPSASITIVVKLFCVPSVSASPPCARPSSRVGSGSGTAALDPLTPDCDCRCRLSSCACPSPLVPRWGVLSPVLSASAIVSLPPINSDPFSWLWEPLCAGGNSPGIR